MMIFCANHGYGPAIQVSPDLSKRLENSDLPKFRELLYEYDGEIYIRMLVSERFAEDRGIRGSGNLELPSDYPDWHKEMVVVCEKCVTALVSASS